MAPPLQPKVMQMVLPVLLQEARAADLLPVVVWPLLVRLAVTQ
jgi:hypothetical protein